MSFPLFVNPAGRRVAELELHIAMAQNGMQSLCVAYGPMTCSFLFKRVI